MNYIKNLIIITGPSCVGKSVLGNILNNKINNSVLLSLDVLKEKIYEIIGYKEGQKPIAEKLIYTQYAELVKLCINRDDDCIICEYPFNSNWIDLFTNINDYNIITVSIKPENLDEWYENFCKRELTEKRHISHLLTSYNSLNTYERKLRHNKEDMIKNVLTDKYNCIQIGTIINIKTNLNSNIEDIADIIIHSLA